MPSLRGGCLTERKLKKENDLEALLQSYIQRQSNPDRIGCQSLDTLKAFLAGTVKPEMAEGLYDHLTHCRECLLELRTLRDMMREEKRKHRRIKR